MREKADHALARKLRREMTDAERRLWRGLRMKQFNAYRFRRQHPLGPYVLDFVCLSAGLVVEVDGSQHLDSPHDAQRDAWLRMQGLRVLRYWNDDVLLRLPEVAEDILRALTEAERPHPHLPPQAGEGV